MIPLPPAAIKSQLSFVNESGPWAPYPSIHGNLWPNWLVCKSSADIYSCSEFMSTMTTSCPEDGFSLPMSHLLVLTSNLHSTLWSWAFGGKHTQPFHQHSWTIFNNMPWKLLIRVSYIFPEFLGVVSQLVKNCWSINYSFLLGIFSSLLFTQGTCAMSIRFRIITTGK